MNEFAPFLRRHFPFALVVADKVIEQGEATHRPYDWRELGYAGNMARVSAHLALLAQGDKSEDHLAHSVCRLLCALDCRERGIP